MMNFFTKLLTPVFIALGMVNPTPVVETPTLDIQVQQEPIELRQKVQELEAENSSEEEETEVETEIITEVEVKIPEPKPVEVKINPTIEPTEPIIEDVPAVEVTQIIEEEIDTSKQDKFDNKKAETIKDLIKENRYIVYSMLSAKSLVEEIDDIADYKCKELLKEVKYRNDDDGYSVESNANAYEQYHIAKNKCGIKSDKIEELYWKLGNKLDDNISNSINNIRKEAESWGVEYMHLIPELKDLN